MKNLMLVFALALSFSATAGFIERHYYYIHNSTFERLDLIKIDQETQVGKYYDHQDGKYKKVSMTELSRQTHQGIRGFKPGNMVLARFSDNQYRACELWYIFENEVAHIGCQTGKISQNIGVNRPQVATYVANINHLINEVSTLDGLSKKDKVRLMVDIGDLRKGDLVRIEHIFGNGSAMIQKMGANLLDTSGLLMKSRVQVVELKDLSQNI